MKTLFNVLLALSLMTVGGLIGSQVVAHGNKDGDAAVSVKPLISEIPGDLGNKRITMVEVTYPPGSSFQAHKHPGTVLAFVHSGTIRSQLGTDENPITYQAGDSWYEPPGARHIHSDNPSDTEPAKIIAILIGDDGAELVQPDAQ